MAKVKGITGNKFPKTGETNIYEVIREDNTLPEDYENVSWQLYLKDETGNWIKHPKSAERKQKGAKQSYAFGELFTNQELLLTAFNEKAVFSEPPALKITPIAGDPKITKFFFTDLTGKTLEEIFYNQRMMLQIHTVGMLGKKVNYSIYYDANGTKTEVRKGQSKEIIKPNGVVNPEESFIIDMPIRTGQSTSADEHHFKIKIWETGNEANFLEQDLKIKNQTVNQMSDPETQVTITTGTSELPKKKEEEKKCFCKKEFSVEDIKSFYNSKKLFSAKNCPLPENMKTYEEFTKCLNKAMKDNGIDTCIRKAHFLAQIETESDRLNTTMEYADGWDYDHSTHIDNYNKYKPYANYKKDKKLSEELHKKYTEEQIKKLKRGYNRYNECISNGHNVKGYGPKYKGKGLIQLTWKSTYEKYFNHIKKSDLIDTPEVVAKDLNYSCDSAGWFWNNRSLGDYADKDDLIFISVRINGGLNGYEHRKSNVKSIIKLMKIETNCTTNNLKSIGKYKYETSAIKNLKWGKDNKSKIEKYDD